MYPHGEKKRRNYTRKTLKPMEQVYMKNYRCPLTHTHFHVRARRRRRWTADGDVRGAERTRGWVTPIG